MEDGYRSRAKSSTVIRVLLIFGRKNGSLRAGKHAKHVLWQTTFLTVFVHAKHGFGMTHSGMTHQGMWNDNLSGKQRELLRSLEHAPL